MKDQQLQRSREVICKVNLRGFYVYCVENYTSIENFYVSHEFGFYAAYIMHSGRYESKVYRELN